MQDLEKLACTEETRGIEDDSGLKESADENERKVERSATVDSVSRTFISQVAVLDPKALLNVCVTIREKCGQQETIDCN